MLPECQSIDKILVNAWFWCNIYTHWNKCSAQKEDITVCHNLTFCNKFAACFSEIINLDVSFFEYEIKQSKTNSFTIKSRALLPGTFYPLISRHGPRGINPCISSEPVVVVAVWEIQQTSITMCKFHYSSRFSSLPQKITI